MYNYRMVTDDLYWVGADEHRLALFENIHPLYHGVSYNAYVLLDEKTVLFDTADWAVGRQFYRQRKGRAGRPPPWTTLSSTMWNPTTPPPLRRFCCAGPR